MTPKARGKLTWQQRSLSPFFCSILISNKLVKTLTLRRVNRSAILHFCMMKLTDIYTAEASNTESHSGGHSSGHTVIGHGWPQLWARWVTVMVIAIDQSQLDFPWATG